MSRMISSQIPMPAGVGETPGDSLGLGDGDGLGPGSGVSVGGGLDDVPGLDGSAGSSVVPGRS
jgi:hypothetical protein